MQSTLRDVRHGLKALLRNPGFAIAAVFSIAVGIGANAAVFSLVDLLFLRPLPVSNPESLVFVTDERSAEQRNPAFSYPFYAVLKENTVLSGLAARFKLGLNAEIDGHPARISGELVSGNYFRVVRAETELGRALTPGDDQTPGGHPVIVISESLWRREFGAEPTVLGRIVKINNHAFTIVGVVARDFTGTDIGQPTEVWLPMMMQAQVGRDLLDDWRTNWLGMIGRLQNGMSSERAAAELTAYEQRRRDALPPRGSDAQTPRIALLPAEKGSSAARNELGPALRLLMTMTALALLLACVNVANLLLVRSAAREREIAVRLALGARRMVLVRQVLVETLLLAAIGGTAGILLAPWAARLLVASRQLQLEPTIDSRVFLFGLGASALTGVLIGLAPILASRRIGLQLVWATSSRASAVLGRPTLRDLMVVCQIAVSLAMLIGAALLMQSFRSLSSIDPGFRADNLVLISLDPASAGYKADRVDEFWRDALERVKQVPGVRTVSLGNVAPLAPSRQRQKVLDVTAGEYMEMDTIFVAPDYFRTLEIPMIRGREFAPSDRRTSRLVVIVNESLARRFWPGEEAVGKQIQVKTGEGQVHEVVGVVKDAKYRNLRGDVGPIIYRPILQTRSTDSMTLHIRTAGDPEGLIGTVRREMQILDPNVPLYRITTLESELNASFAQTREAAVLTSGFGVLALMLSAIGVYGVTALTVNRQTRNIGIRIALGATGRDIIRVLTRRGFTIVTTGLVLGLGGSYGLTQIAGSLLFGVTAGDTVTFAVMTALLIAICLVAIYIPASAATRLDPVAAIRHE